MLRALLVDDSLAMRHLLEEVVREEGYEVVSVASGELAIQEFARSAFQLVLVDWTLPGISGPELCRATRKRPDGAQTYILAVSGRNRASEIRTVLDAGANDFLAKPIDSDALRVRLRVAAHRAERIPETRTFTQRLALPLPDAPVAILSMRDGAITDVNPQAELLFEKSRNELVGQRFDSLIAASRGDECLVRTASHLLWCSRKQKASGSGSYVTLIPSGNDAESISRSILLDRVQMLGSLRNVLLGTDAHDPSKAFDPHKAFDYGMLLALLPPEDRNQSAVDTFAEKALPTLCRLAHPNSEFQFQFGGAARTNMSALVMSQLFSSLVLSLPENSPQCALSVHAIGDSATRLELHTQADSEFASDVVEQLSSRSGPLTAPRMYHLGMLQSMVVQNGGTLSVAFSPPHDFSLLIELPAPAVRMSSRPPAALGLARVLVVDESDVTARSLRVALPDCHVDAARTGADALRRMKSETAFDVIVCNLSLRGIGASEIVEEQSRHPQTKLVFLSATRPSGSTPPPDTRDWPVLPRPIDIDALRAAVRYAIDSELE